MTPQPKSQSQNPVISVVVPVYNGQETISDTIEAVLSQHLEAFELIIVNDGSTDETSKILDQYAGLDGRVKILNKENSGIADARNAGIEAACAPFIAPVDADDIWHPTYLEKMLNAMHRGGDTTVMAYANFRKVDMEGNVIGTAPAYDASGNTQNRFLICNFVGNGSGIVFRKEAASKVGAYNRDLQYKYTAHGCEDWLLQMELASIGNVVVVQEYLVGYRVVPGSMSANDLRMRRSRLRALETVMENHAGFHPQAVKWAFSNAQTACAITSVKKGYFKEAGMLLYRAARHDFKSTALKIADQSWYRFMSFVKRRLLKGATQEDQEPVHFMACDPCDGQKGPLSDLQTRQVRRAQEWDADISSYR